jgi:hypothetical protein
VVAWIVVTYDWGRLAWLARLHEAVACWSCLQSASAFLVMAFPAYCLVGQMPHARFVGMLSVTLMGLEINSTIVSHRFNVTSTS